jgi:hypothetical protein
MNHLQILNDKSPGRRVSVFSGSKFPNANKSPLVVLCKTVDTAGYSNIQNPKFLPTLQAFSFEFSKILTVKRNYATSNSQIL